MPSEATPIGVGIIGPARSVHYIRERLSIRREFVSVATHATGGEHWNSSERDDGLACPSPFDVIRHHRGGLIYFSGPVPEQWVATAIEAKKHVVLESPPAISSAELRSLAEFAIANEVVATLHQPRYWSEDFLCARHVVQNNMTGRLLRIRLAIHEHLIPGETFSRGVLCDIGFHSLDQLFLLLDDEPCSVSFRPFPRSGESTYDGFLAVIDFVGGASAMIELQTRSLLSLRTGWLLEGTNGAYRSGRYYSKTKDGEIVDEPVTKPNISDDPFFDALFAVLRREEVIGSTLQELSHSARVMKLIDQLERSVR